MHIHMRHIGLHLCPVYSLLSFAHLVLQLVMLF